MIIHPEVDPAAISAGIAAIHAGLGIRSKLAVGCVELTVLHASHDAEGAILGKDIASKPSCLSVSYTPSIAFAVGKANLLNCSKIQEKAVEEQEEILGITAIIG